MRNIIIIIALFVATAAQAQTKKLQEQFGNYRIHQVQSFIIDTIVAETTIYEYKAKIIILREGIDGGYDYVITKDLYGNVNKTIDYMAIKPEYVNYKVIK